ncbi:MAG: FAD-dependent oxidoreductase, partial [Planctomycetota bacterium]|nr:FAD-dependent oxidoreductase [Planctomycetota bacterium]
FAHRAPENHVLIRIFVGGAMQAELLHETDDAIIKLVRDELSELIGLSGEPAVAKVVRWNEAMPQYHVGHLERIKTIEQEISQVPSLRIVSNAMRGVGISPVISQASKVATDISERYVELSHPPSGQ